MKLSNMRRDFSIEEILNMSFKEKIESLLDDVIRKTKFLNLHLLIYDIEINNKYLIFQDALEKSSWIKFDEVAHKESDNFNYIYFKDKIKSEKHLYDLFLTFKDKTLIFENDELLKKQSYINILNGAICSSSDSITKWPIRLKGQKEFKFNGSVILLTNQKKENLVKKEKYYLLLRDMIKA